MGVKAKPNASVSKGVSASRRNSKSSKYFGKNGKKTEGDEDEEPSESSSEADGEDDFEDASEVESLDSDALDEEDENEFEPSGRSGTKRKRAASSPKKSASKKTGRTKAGAKASPKKKGAISARKKRKTAEESEDEESELELEEGQQVVGVVVQAPKTGRVPPGQISQNTLDFLSELKKPECNDREWFKLHEPVYRVAEKEWKDFVEHFTDVLVDVDPQIPHLPPKDVIHRIYRDVRFSNDKTPYKTGFSASFSRSGRKGIFAHFQPNGESLMAAGSWCPGRNELATMRANLQRSSRRFREIISAPEFEALFGPAKPHPKGKRQNIFGGEDELKVAPKGVDKTHTDIDILKCRSFAVVFKFTDKQVLSPDFKDELASVAKVMRPFVHCLNDLMTLQDAGSSDEDDQGADEDHSDAGDAEDD
ncbi:hypothetical protein DICSQDRAFT_171662 [Dichomitus squalens LYAD-421 SS1]|uniref:TIGR02453 family protein n=1 Tax=Dichomitus squalens (strain LYAD-421) TaxID=732165 RepID=R7SVI5_DICSQ|nr:uncharacterized protein DICSQDRAFT_171662 [Dichomitus squalens LYAD-421 SS1]EJF59938.1 hypothetical protein DICSQDRAFT_171662 [Dichomitus squalens LYAD-421 SS1]